jgi:RHS repeat-associated protein
VYVDSDERMHEAALFLGTRVLSHRARARLYRNGGSLSSDYDARGRRVLKVVTNKGSLNGTTRFVWGGDSDWQCLEERAGDGRSRACGTRYTYAPGYIDAVAVQERDLNADDDFGDTNEVVYYHASTLFSVCALSDASESVVERYRYDAYGACTVLDADGSADADGLSDVGNPYAFTGRRLELGSEAMQYRHRYYTPRLGRPFSREDPGHAPRMNLYEFVMGRPTRWADPSGFEPDAAELGPDENLQFITVYDSNSKIAGITALIEDIEAGRTKIPPASRPAALNALRAQLAAITPDVTRGFLVDVVAHKVQGQLPPDLIECYAQLTADQDRCRRRFAADPWAIPGMVAGIGGAAVGGYVAAAAATATVSTCGIAAAVIGVVIFAVATGDLVYNAIELRQCYQEANDRWRACARG